MVHLRILSGPEAGAHEVVRHFPFYVGRAQDNDLCLDGAGIWDYHFKLELRANEGFLFETCDQAFAAVNDAPQTSARLRNGDVISFGAGKIQFWLAASAQRGMRLREAAVWLLVLIITAIQLGIIRFLLKLSA